jgi:hypothetical protein
MGGSPSAEEARAPKSRNEQFISDDSEAMASRVDSEGRTEAQSAERTCRRSGREIVGLGSAV